MGGRRWVSGLVVATALLGLGLVSNAWGCTATTFLRVAPVEAARPGEQLTVQVLAVTTAGPVELRLIDAPATSAPLASAFATKGQDFSMPLTVPDLSPGVHYLGLVSEDKFIARAAIEVLSTSETASVVAAPRADVARPAQPGGSLLPLAVTFASAGAAAIGGLTLVVARRRRARATLSA